MKITNKLAILFWLAALIFLPFQAVQAKGLPDGPIFGENYTLKSGETRTSDLVVFGGSIAIEKDARVKGTVVLFGGSVNLDGEVDGDLVVIGGAVKLSENAHVNGNLVTIGAPVNRAEGAKVDGEVINNPTRPEVQLKPGTPISPLSGSWGDNPIWNAFVVFGQSLMFALLAALIALFLPTQLRRVSDGLVAQPLVSFGFGLLTLILFIVLVVALGLFSFLLITIILTLPLILVIAVLFSAGSVLGWLAIGTEIGLRSAAMFKRELPLPLAAALGVFFLNIVAQGIGFIPCVGGMLSSLLGLAGLGAVALTRFGTRSASLISAASPASVSPTES
jgi:hypothetical protein